MTDKTGSMSAPLPSRGLMVAVVTVFVLCVLLNILALTSALYTLQIYDRVLASRSVPTLLALSVLALGLLVVFGLLDAIRSTLLVRIADRFDSRLMAAAHTAGIRLRLLGMTIEQAGQPVRDADVVRGFLSGPAPLALLDLPWIPLFLFVIWLMSPPLAMAAAGGVVILLIVTVLAEIATARAEARAALAAQDRRVIADACLRNAAAIKAMGMGDSTAGRFLRSHDDLIAAQSAASEAIGSYSAVSRTVRIILQVAIVGLGGYLAIDGALTAGAIIAASIAAGRTLAPVEQVIGNWKACVAARRAWARVRESVRLGAAEPARLTIPAPKRRLTIEQVSVHAPTSRRLVLADITLDVAAGSVLGVVGSSGSGKSCLARTIVGVWPTTRGSVRLDDATLDRWAPSELGRHVGYLPQEVELFPGTIAENIARLATQPDHAAVVRAALAAGIHEMILRLPDGYETWLGSDATTLSGGQRQRVGIARALYGEPFLVVLDEPNSNLDAEGEGALRAAIDGVRQRGGIVVVIAHRNSILNAADRIAYLDAGRLIQVNERQPSIVAPLRLGVGQRQSAAIVDKARGGVDAAAR